MTVYKKYNQYAFEGELDTGHLANRICRLEAQCTSAKAWVPVY